MPFGLRNAAQTFQRFMDEVTRGLAFVFVYIDDILIASTNALEHEVHLRLLFDRSRKYGVIIDPAKSVFGVSTLEFLGHKDSTHGIHPLYSRTQAIVISLFLLPSPSYVNSLAWSISIVVLFPSVFKLSNPLPICFARMGLHRKHATPALNGQQLPPQSLTRSKLPLLSPPCCPTRNPMLHCVS